MAPWKFLIFIIRFSWIEVVQVSSAFFMVEFSQILPFSSTHLGFFSDFYWDMLGHLVNIYNLFYHIVVLKKKLLKTVLLGHYLGKNWASMSHTQNEAQFVFLETTKEDHELSRTFLFIKISHVLAVLWMIFWLVWYFATKASQFWAETGILNLSLINFKDRSKYSTVKQTMDILKICLYNLTLIITKLMNFINLPRN